MKSNFGLERSGMTRDEYGLAYQQGFDLTVRFLINRSAQRDLARDVAQSAWVRGWERLHQFRNESDVRSWINTIALNVLRSILRSPGNEVGLSGSFGKERGFTPSLDTEIDLRSILRKCSVKDRQLLEMRMRGMTDEETGRLLGISPTAARIRVFRARRRARSRCEL
jgi:RNA polymerase sigma factor (sigma-70 family)